MAPTASSLSLIGHGSQASYLRDFGGRPRSCSSGVVDLERRLQTATSPDLKRSKTADL